ncbi:uncharacterized protein LOC122364827 [Amphibalanus amphitrite]|uniref:uncharacterized protein LOC122364827 n=1 Tax=Amphibalanus amphitrite TaxID=1232801 RepID=UPI001C909563|nr:uncharacterized protein LOC122364827 [Amphibalanus amphitrite]
MRLVALVVTAALAATDGAAQQDSCECLQWTPWVNADQVDSDGGDFETLGYNVASEGGWPGRVTRQLARQGVVCNTPVRVECRHARSQRPWFEAEDDTVFPRRINCELRDGLVCRDSEQADGRCQDYEVRLLCWTDRCDQLRWGEWLDRDNPGGSCDCEHPGWADHPVRNVPACPDGGSPLEVDCRTTAGIHAALSSNRAVTCSVDGGFSCWNSAQTDGTSCLDYKVRYLCGNPAP